MAIGLADRLAALGRHVIMPDTRGRGHSAKPHDAAAYPPGVLTTDTFALIDRLGLSDYDLGGYSVDARTVARMLALGATPTRAIIGGTGLEPITPATARGNNYHHILTNLGTLELGSPEAPSRAMDPQGGQRPRRAPPGARLLHRHTDRGAWTDHRPHGRSGRGGSIDARAAAIPGSCLQWLAGDHIEALLSPRSADAFVEFSA